MERLFQSVQIGDTDAFNRYIDALLPKKSSQKESSKKEPLLNTPDFAGSCLIHYAVEGGYLDICQNLVEKGASVNVGNRQNESPLHIAAKKQYVKICSYLLEKGSILDAKI